MSAKPSVICVLACTCLTAPTVDIREMDGNWHLHSWIDDGVKLDITLPQIPNRLVVVNGSASLYVDEKLHTDGIEYTFGKNTKGTTFAIRYSGNDKTLAEYFRSKAFHGIFKIVDGKLYRCYVSGDNPLPEEFESQFGSHRQLQVFVKHLQK
jgi:hypothetical protein